MPAAPSEPEKYSIDEMMDRLKSKPAEDPIEEGELVTRADGSQAIRVRKRKRRSNQPQKEKAARGQRAKIVQLSAALVLLMVAAVLVGAAFIYTNSTPFRENLLQKASVATGAKVELKQFRMSPTSANAHSLIMVWPEGNVLESLDLRQLKAQIQPSSIIGATLTGEELTAVEGELSFRLPVDGQPMRAAARGEGPLPMNFNRLGVNRLNLTLGEDPQKSIRLLKSEASFYARNVNERPELRLNRGELAINGWPALRLDRAFIEFRGNETDVISMRLLHEKDEAGIFTLSGTLRPYSPQSESTLVAQLESFQIGGITGPSMSRFFVGKIDSVSGENLNTLKFSPEDLGAGTLSVSFQTSITSFLQVSGFPFLNGLSQTLEDKWFEQPLFEQDSTGTIERSGGLVRIRDLQMLSKGRLAIRGDIQINPDQTLSGELEVGVATAMITAAPTRRLDTIFSPDRNGFRWMTVTLSGTASAPNDDFRDIFTAVEKPSAESEDVPPVRFEDLTRPR